MRCRSCLKTRSGLENEPATPCSTRPASSSPPSAATPKRHHSHNRPSHALIRYLQNYSFYPLAFKVKYYKSIIYPLGVYNQDGTSGIAAQQIGYVTGESVIRIKNQGVIQDEE